MNIVREIELNVSLFTSEKYIDRLNSLLKAKTPLKKNVKKYILSYPIEVSKLTITPKEINFWRIIAENVINFKDKYSETKSENFIRKYIAHKAKKILTALSMIELKFKIKKEFLIDVYIYLCKNYSKTYINRNYFISKREELFYNDFITGMKRSNNAKEKIERMHLAESFINSSMKEDDYRFKQLIHKMKKSNSVIDIRDGKEIFLPKVKIPNGKILPKIQTNISSIKLYKENHNRNTARKTTVSYRKESEISDKLFVYKPINKKKIYSSGDVYRISNNLKKSCDYYDKHDLYYDL